MNPRARRMRRLRRNTLRTEHRIIVLMRPFEVVRIEPLGLTRNTYGKQRMAYGVYWRDNTPKRHPRFNLVFP